MILIGEHSVVLVLCLERMIHVNNIGNIDTCNVKLKLNLCTNLGVVVQVYPTGVLFT